MAGAAAPKLFRPVRLGCLELSHGVVMAPLTRMRASQPGNVPTALNAEYYAQRSSPGGLIVAEATQVCPGGQAYPNTPGIHTEEQVAGWRLVTDAVHARGGLIVLQLWHTGRISNHTYQPDGGQAVAPSAVAASGNGTTKDGVSVPHELPRALRLDEIPGVVEQYRTGALLARRAGFDGVEVHGANGYLPDQFLQDGSNLRDDKYGGSFENRTRFLLEVLDAVLTVWPAGRVGLRLSPFGSFGTMSDSRRPELFEHVIRSVDPLGLAYLHVVCPRANGPLGEEGGADTETEKLLARAGYRGPVIVAGGMTRDLAIEAVDRGYASAVAFGRRFISNPDLPERLRLNLPLAVPDRSKFYGGGADGYTTYKRASESEAKL